MKSRIYSLLSLFSALFLATEASAASVKSPYVDKGTIEVELEGLATFDNDRANSDEHELGFEFSYSPTSFWRTEVEIEAAREAGPGEDFRYQSFAWENTFALGKPGEFWVDPAAYLELGFGRDDEPNSVTAGFIGAIELGLIDETFNLFVKKEYDPDNSATSFIYRNQTAYRWQPWLQPGFEIYGETDGKARFDDQQLSIGPVLLGNIKIAENNFIGYELGLQFGATTATADNAIRWKLEYEF